MGFIQRTWGSRQSWGSVGNLLGRTASRLQPDWAARHFQENGETFVLTEADELSRTFCKDSNWSPNSPTPAIGGTGTPLLDAAVTITVAVATSSPQKGQPSRTSASKERPSPSNASRIKTTPTSTEPSTNTSTSLLSHQYLRSTNDTGKYEAGDPGATSNTVSNMIDSPVYSVNRSTATAAYTLKTGRGKVDGGNQVVPEPDLGSPVQWGLANITGPQEEPSLHLQSGARDDHGGIRGGLGAEACIPASPQEEGQTRGESERDEETRSSIAEGVEEANPSITTWEAGWNVTNAIQGMFVLGLPYALLSSGYLGLLVLVLAPWICNHTGNILVSCLYEEDYLGCDNGLTPGLVRIRHSYQDIAEACCKGLWPNCAGLAGWVVNVAQVIELLMTCTLYLVVSATLLSDGLWWMAVPRPACSLACLLLLLPCLVLTDLRPISTLSMLCSLAHILISLLVILYCLSASGGWSLSPLTLAVAPGDFLLSLGVILFSYTSQIFLPALEGSMEHRAQFPAMLGRTHAAACVMKTTFSLLAVLTWGKGTSEVITDNLPANLRPFVNVCLVAKALLSYPLPFYSAAQILQSCLSRGSATSVVERTGGGRLALPRRRRHALLVRGALLVSSYLLAVLVPRFSLMMGLTGSVTGAAMTLVLPCLFHLRLRWRRLTAGERLADVAILSLGLLCSTSGLICSVQRLVQGL